MIIYLVVDRQAMHHVKFRSAAENILVPQQDYQHPVTLRFFFSILDASPRTNFLYFSKLILIRIEQQINEDKNLKLLSQ